jgi:hypothetical protein
MLVVSLVPAVIFRNFIPLDKTLAPIAGVGDQGRLSKSLDSLYQSQCASREDLKSTRQAQHPDYQPSPSGIGAFENVGAGEKTSKL